jgi:hypothetical protein
MFIGEPEMMGPLGKMGINGKMVLTCITENK